MNKEKFLIFLILRDEIIMIFDVHDTKKKRPTTHILGVGGSCLKAITNPPRVVLHKCT
jgi:hypothetical protein